ncbi:hypothetical protein GCM10023208_19310 [Erythrobacter westpacificensis]|uniref:DUF4013 domain-containing protein n=1 Tax=Erythrobacter westpacificensis TaxID=1055231 RepID=A0ABP9KEC2_9SPHN
MIRPVDMLRIALGAITVPTALAYFLPDLLPWVRTAQWQGAMATRLMGQLDASGLLAVAKFIQLAGGIALLLNRAVPFALAAMVAVNVCGAFVAALIDGGVLLSLLAPAVLALNVVLMLAYLPAYRGVLALRALADGESAQPGENYESLFVIPLSRASRKACLIAALPLIGAAWFFWQVVPGLNSLTGLIVLVLPALALLANFGRARGR